MGLRQKNIIIVNRDLHNKLTMERGDAGIARKTTKLQKPEVTWNVGTPNAKQKQAFLARTLYVGYGGA